MPTYTYGMTNADRLAMFKITKSVIEQTYKDTSATLKTQLATADDTRRSDLDSNDADYRAARSAAEAAIAADFYGQMDPLMDSWVAGPSRSIATSIAAAWQTYQDRTQSELGLDLSSRCLAIALASAMRAATPNIEKSVVTPISLIIEFTDEAVRGISSSAVFDDKLRALEIKLGWGAGGRAAGAKDLEVFAALRTVVTHAGLLNATRAAGGYV